MSQVIDAGVGRGPGLRVVEARLPDQVYEKLIGLCAATNLTMSEVLEAALANAWDEIVSIEPD